jgi:hypothetical protein
MIVDKVWKLTNTVRFGLDDRSSHTRDNPLSRIMCPSVSCKMKKRNEKTITGEGGNGKRSRTVSDDAGGKSLSDTSTSAREQCVGERSTGAKSTVILGWVLETCAENFPCHQYMPVSNLYVKTSGRTWRIGGSQI